MLELAKLLEDVFFQIQEYKNVCGVWKGTPLSRKLKLELLSTRRMTSPDDSCLRE